MTRQTGSVKQPVEQPVEQPVPTSPALLRERLQRQLRRSLGPLAKLKESFRQTPATVEFRLLALLPGQAPHELVCVERPRLKPARLAAYEAALAAK